MNKFSNFKKRCIEIATGEQEVCASDFNEEVKKCFSLDDSWDWGWIVLEAIFERKYSEEEIIKWIDTQMR